MLQYRQEVAPAHLVPWVECTWTLEGAAEGETECILPDGRMELVVHLGARPRDQAASFVTGQLTAPLVIYPTGPMLTHGVRLRPEAAGAFLQMPACELTGHFVSLKMCEPRVMPDAAIGHAVGLIERSAGRVRMDRVTGEVNLSPRHFDRRFLAAVGLLAEIFQIGWILQWLAGSMIRLIWRMSFVSLQACRQRNSFEIRVCWHC